MSRPRLFAAILAVAAAAAAQSTLVIPAGFANSEGNSGNQAPWGNGGGGLQICNLYDSSHFTLQGITTPILITRLRWRVDSSAARTWANLAYPNAFVRLSTCPVDQSAVVPGLPLSTYQGYDRQQCFAGPVSIAGGTSAPPGPTPNWLVDVPLQAPFFYDPARGDLNIETELPISMLGTTNLWLDVASGIVNCSRAFISAGYPTGTPATTLGHGVVVEVSHTAPTLHADFFATPTNGLAPLAVSFTDRSWSGAPGGIASWAWDFDGDNVVDSTLPNPTFVYGACGTYTVSLTVTDALHPAATRTRSGYVVVEGITADFTASTAGGLGPVAVNFTDTSTGPVNAWAWDLDGDSVVDSTQQHPSWNYAVPGQYTVTLTITNSCHVASRTRTNLITVVAPSGLPAPPELFQYQFDEVRGQEVANSAASGTAPAQGTVNVANWWSDPGRAGFRGNEPGFGCLGYRATGAGFVDTGFPTAVSGSFTVSFWVKRDPASVIFSNPSVYVFGNTIFRMFAGGVAGSGITFRGTLIGNVNSAFDVMNMPGVWRHLALVVDDQAGQARWYDNGLPGPAVVNFAPNTFTYSSPSRLAVGASSTLGFDRLAAHFHFDDFRFYLRALTPAQVLALALTPEGAAAGASGQSCPGPLGTPVIGSTGGVPAEGNLAFTITLANAEDQRAAAIALGLAPAAFGVLDLSAWLGAGCVLQNDPVALGFTVTNAGAAQYPFAIPAGLGLAGVHVYAQWVVLGTTGAATRMLDVAIR